MSVRYFVISLLFCSITTKFAYHQANIFQENEKTRDSPNVPRSAERSAKCSVIFGQFLVLLFNGRTGKVKRNPYFQHFFFRTVLLLFQHFLTFFHTLLLLFTGQESLPTLQIIMCSRVQGVHHLDFKYFKYNLHLQ